MARGVSEVEIANSCFRKVGVRQKITSFTQGTTAANFAADRYPELRDKLLRVHPWNFARKWAKLAKLSTGPTVPADWNYFQFPDDWMRTLGVFDNDAGVGALEWYSESNKISAGREELWMSYVCAVEDPNTMTPDFREALAFLMAIEAAVDIVGSRTLSERMEARYETAFIQAKSADAMGDGPRRLPHGTWVTSRFRGTQHVISTS